MIKKESLTSLILLGVVSQIITIVLQLLSIPIYIRYWGENYALWLYVSSIANIIKVLDAGPANYEGNRIALAYCAGDSNFKKMLSESVFAMIVFGIIEIIFSLIIILVKYLSDGVVEWNTYLSISVLAAFWGLSGAYIGVLHRLMLVVEMQFSASAWYMVYQSTGFALLMLSAVNGLNILDASIVFGLGQFLIYVLSAVHLKYARPEITVSAEYFKFKYLYTSFVQAFPFTLSQVMQQAGISGFQVLAGKIIGVETLPMIAVCRTASNFWNMAAQIFSAALIPKLLKKSNGEINNDILKIINFISFALSSLIALSVIFSLPFWDIFFRKWLGSRFSIDIGLFSLFVCSVALAGLTTIPNNFYQALNKTSFILKISAIRGAVVLPLLIFLAYFYGLRGAGYAILLSEACLYIYVFSFSAKINFETGTGADFLLNSAFSIINYLILLIVIFSYTEVESYSLIVLGATSVILVSLYLFVKNNDRSKLKWLV